MKKFVALLLAAMMLLAMVACGAYATVADACRTIVRVASTVRPEPSLAAAYERRYQQFRRIYPACKQLFADFAKEES